MEDKKPFNYIDEAHVTLSHDFYGDNVPLDIFENTLAEAIGNLRQLDVIKKSLFYGREFPFTTDFETCALLPTAFDDPRKGEYLIHAIIGIATEAGELLELLAKTLAGEKFDWVNATEEQGDSFWYHAILAKLSNLTFENIQSLNIAKLRYRYPNKFSEYDANNRKLDGEREVLEKKINTSSMYGVGDFDNESENHNCEECQACKPVEFSKRGLNWNVFADKVFHHVETYTVPQYGDEGTDNITDWSDEDCYKAIEKYFKRRNSNAREGQKELDLLKIAHYASLAYEKLPEGK